MAVDVHKAITRVRRQSDATPRCRNLVLATLVSATARVGLVPTPFLLVVSDHMTVPAHESCHGDQESRHPSSSSACPKRSGNPAGSGGCAVVPSPSRFVQLFTLLRRLLPHGSPVSGSGRSPVQWLSLSKSFCRATSDSHADVPSYLFVLSMGLYVAVRKCSCSHFARQLSCWWKHVLAGVLSCAVIVLLPCADGPGSLRGAKRHCLALRRDTLSFIEQSHSVRSLTLTCLSKKKPANRRSSGGSRPTSFQVARACVRTPPEQLFLA